jgi:hypothetical protein
MFMTSLSSTRQLNCVKIGNFQTYRLLRICYSKVDKSEEKVEKI